MSKLIFSLDGAFLGEYPLDQGRMTIGRRPGNDIHIDNLAISGAHAAVTEAGGEYFLEDLDSTNGTLVNGKAIKKHVLQHGDVIELGKYQLKFLSDAVLQNLAMGGGEGDPGAHLPAESEVAEEAPLAPASAPQPEATKVAAALPDWAHPPKPSSSVVAQPKLAEPSQALAHIRVLNGTSAGKELVLSKALTTLGKPGVQVAVISRRPHGYFVTHIEGGRHPIVNGSSVGAQAHQLQDRDVVEIAGVKMEFYFVDN